MYYIYILVNNSGAELDESDLDSDTKPGSLEEGFAFLPDIPLLPYQCSYCSFSADTATALHDHIENTHSYTISVWILQAPLPKPHPYIFFHTTVRQHF